MVFAFLFLFVPYANGQETKDGWVHELGVCESGWRPHLKHLDSNDYYSYGVLQFQMHTWLAQGGTKGNIYDSDLQMAVTESMLDKGLSWNWKTCYAKTTKLLGAYPK